MFLCDRSPRMMPKVYRFYYPIRQHSYQICAFSTLLMSILTCLFGIFIPIYESAPLTLSRILLVISAISILFMFQARDQIPKGRLRRLSRLLVHPQALNRLPHRAVERLYRSVFPLPPRKLPHILKSLPKGTNILTNGPKEADVTLPAPSDIFFEPADIHEASEYMDIFRLGYGETMPYTDTNEDDSESTKGKRPAIPFWMRRIGGTIMSVMGIACLIWYITLGLYKKDYTNTIFWIFWMMVILGQYWLHIFYANQWWLIPGGIIGREYRLWRKRLGIRIIRAPQAVSFYDMHRKELHIACDGQVIDLSIEPIQYLAFLVAWLSTARSPSEEEIKSFLDAR